MSTLTINKLYSFSTLAPSILGAFFNVRLVAIMDYNLAIQQKNVELLHRQIAPFLLSGSPTDVKKFTFYKFQINVTDFVVVCDHWVTQDGFTASTSVDVVVRIFNANEEEDVDIIREQLRLLGYTFTIATVDH